MKTTIKLAIRNLLRNRRRTIITSLTFAVGMAIIIVTNTIMKGSHESNIERAVRRSSGHYEILYRGFLDKQTLYYSLETSHVNGEAIRAIPGVEALLYRISAPVLAESEGRTRLIILRGIDPEKEADYGGLKANLKSGSYLDSGDLHGAYVGSGMAEALHLKPGDPMFVIGEARDMSVAAGAYTVRGIFETGSADLDRNLMLVPYESAKEVFVMEGFATEGVVMIKSYDEMDRVGDTIRKLLGPDEELVPWKKIIPELVQLVALDAAFGEIMIIILAMIAVFGVINTLITSILERRREFAMIMALGAPRKTIFQIVITESILLTFVSILPGVLLGIIGSVYFIYNPIVLTGEAARSMQSWGFEPFIYGRLSFKNLWATSLSFLVLGLVFSLWPALLAARTKIMKRLQRTE